MSNRKRLSNESNYNYSTTWGGAKVPVKKKVNVIQKKSRRPFDGIHFLGRIGKDELLLNIAHLDKTLNVGELLSLESILLTTPVIFHCCSITTIKEEDTEYKLFGFSKTTSPLTLVDDLLQGLIKNTFSETEKGYEGSEILKRQFIVVPLLPTDSFDSYLESNKIELGIKTEELEDLRNYKDLIPDTITVDYHSE